MTRFVALLRGINVGGRNPVPMDTLRAAFTDAGYGEVSTYIQSGNVCFEADGSARTLETDVEALLEERLGLPLVVVVRSHRQLRAVVEHAPEGFGADTHHNDVLFLRHPLTARQAMAVVVERPGVDQAWPGTGVVYFSRLSARRTESRMGRIVGTAPYRRMTIRSWATTTKLLALLDAAG